MFVAVFSMAITLWKLQVEVNKGTPLTLHHRYSDMKWLYRLLSRKEDLSGHIVSHATVVRI